jgi:hypothetical protein
MEVQGAHRQDSAAQEHDCWLVVNQLQHRNHNKSGDDPATKNSQLITKKYMSQRHYIQIYLIMITMLDLNSGMVNLPRRNPTPGQ